MSPLASLLMGSTLAFVALALKIPGKKPLQCKHANDSFAENVSTALRNLGTDMQKLDSTLYLLKKLGSDVEGLKSQMKTIKEARSDPSTTTTNATDCLDIFNNGQLNEGVYTITPEEDNSFDVYCKQGWTYIMKRVDGKERFNRSWSDYRYGFGNLRQDHWLGLDNLHTLTSTKKYDLRWEFFLDFSKELFKERWALFTNFRIQSRQRLYRMAFDGYTYSDYNHAAHFYKANGMRFTTYDYDNDNFAGNCAKNNRNSGWWYTNCGYSMTANYASSSCTAGNTVCSLVHPGYYVREAKLMIIPSKK